VQYAIDATTAIGTVAPPGRPGLVRGVAIHAVISVLAGELLGFVLPRERSVLWGAVGGLLLGVVNLGVIAPRFYPVIAELELAPQIADNIAFGVAFAAVADR
jgi:hypothetical protein